ncbi:MAG: family Mn2+/Fe2+ transporter, partial [Nitrobacter vulgaris]|nr:family Mn2+/Fe2+ transporter [Nitrobacter vulgaris]
MDMKTSTLSPEPGSEPSQGTFSAGTGWSSEAPVRPSLEEVHATVRVPATGHWLRRMLAFAGPGYMVSVGYMDPGNWATDIAGGSKFGY